MCKYCNSFGKRSYIEGYHFNEIHLTVYCDVCSRNIKKNEVMYHYKMHLDCLQNFKENIDNYLKYNYNYNYKFPNGKY